MESEKYFTLYILLKFDSLDRMRITYLESKFKLGRSGKGLITSLSLRDKTSPRKYKPKMSVRRKSQRLLGNFKHNPTKVRRRRGPKMSLLKFTFA